MLAKLLSRRGAAAPDSLPLGQRVYAVGDVHGRLDLFERLIADIEADDLRRSPADTTVLLLGDLVDRGPDSAQVVERAIRLAESGRRVRLLQGNHEEVFLEALAGDAKALRLFCRVGGRETAISYGLTEGEYDRADFAELHALLDARVPEAHRRFLAGGEDLIVMGDYAFAHAGIRPGRALEEQRVHDLRWIREPFLEHRGRLEKRIVHGHTIAQEPEFRSHRIGIDTGAYATGRLTALGLEGSQQWLIST